MENSSLKTCVICGKEVVSSKTSSGKTKKFCSTDCSCQKTRERARVNSLLYTKKKKEERGIKVCESCGKVFEPKKITTLTCSVLCAKRAFKKRGRAEQLANRKPIPCGYCGKLFKQLSTQEKYCSNQCQVDFHVKKSGVKEVGFARKKEIRKCLTCGKDFAAKKPNHTLCSKRCLDKHERVVNPERVQLRETINRQAKRAKQKGYSGSFSREDWKKIKEKQDNRCAFCKEKRKLTVDHVIPRSKWEHFKDIVPYEWNDAINIQALCAPCNSTKHDKTISFS